MFIAEITRNYTLIAGKKTGQFICRKNPNSLIAILQCILAVCLQKQNILPLATALSPVALLCETVFSQMLASSLLVLVGYSNTPVNDKTEPNFQ